MTNQRESNPDGADPPTIQPSQDNLVCAKCGSAEVECLDWVRVNDDYFIGGNQSMGTDDYWCANCEIHDQPVTAAEYCAGNGHRDNPCAVCGAQ